MAIKKKTEQAETEVKYDVLVTRATWVNENISFSLQVNGVVIHGCWYKVIKNKDGEEIEIVNLPQYKGNDGKYYAIVYFPLKNYKQIIINQIQSLLGE